MAKESNTTEWLYEIKPKNDFFSLNLEEIWAYRDLLTLFIKRDITTVYKQTILGPLWYFIQPLLTSSIFTLIFNNVAGIKTGTIPPFLFNMAGIIMWNYFSSCLAGTADTFKQNQHIFGKVYYPRVIMPLSIVLSNLIKFGIQLLIFMGVYLYFINKGVHITFTIYVIFYPILLIPVIMLSLGLGMIISSLVTKYRDLAFLISFGVQLLMLISLVVLPLSLFQDKGLEWVVKYNPMAHMIEVSRLMLLGEGSISFFGIVFAVFTSTIVLLSGMLIFRYTEKNFIDTI